MAYDRFLIAPLNTGLQTDLKPWLIMDDAYTTLQNAYVFRGRVRKRFGGSLMGNTKNPQLSRLRIQIGVTVNGGDFTGNVRALTANPTLPISVGQMFSIGNQLFTIVSNSMAPAPMLNTGAGIAAFDLANGNVGIVGTGLGNGIPVYFYPSLPVMGITNYEVGAVNNRPSYAFDTNFAYIYRMGSWMRAGNAVWHGTDSDFFWVANWKGITNDSVVMFITNFNATVGIPGANDDPIWTFDGATWLPRTAPGPNGIYFNPAPGNPPTPQPRYTGPYVKSARIIIPFKDRLLLLNTIENNNPNGDGTGGINTAYPQRCRYSQNGSPLAQNAWYEPNQSDSSGTANGLSNAAGAGFIDATTDEEIISAQFIKDRLIVYFERSTWELVYTGNEVLPFRWQKINTELGSVSTFSSVPFDKVVLTISSAGIHACSGANVDRIDNKIPSEIFDFNNNQIERVCGIRDFYNELVYWSFVKSHKRHTRKFPNSVLVYNYQNNSWAINDDCITALGYFEQQTDRTWANTGGTWSTLGTTTWRSGVLQANFKQIIAGNQQGYLFIINSQGGNTSRNAPVLQITNMVINNNGSITLTIVNHNLIPGEFIAIENAQGVNNINVHYDANYRFSYGIYKIEVINGNNVTISLNQGQVVTGVYTGGGNATRVSNIIIDSKQWNPYVDKGRNVYLAKIDFAVNRTDYGEITVDYSPSSSGISMVEHAKINKCGLGTNILETFPYPLVPLEASQQRLWHPVYFQSQGECIQIKMYMNKEQLSNPSIAWQDFVLEGLVLHTQSTSNRLE
jgi:hypothetical protein